MVDKPYYDFAGVRPQPFARALEKRPLPFCLDEYRARGAAAMQHLAALNLDYLLISDSSNLCYLTGYEGMSDYVEQALVYCAKGDEPCFFLRRQDAPSAMYQTWLNNESIVPYPERYIGDSQDNGFTFIFKDLAAKTTAQRIGLEMGALTADTALDLKERYPQINFVDCSGLVDEARLIKSPAEQKHLRDAGAMTEAVAKRLPRWFKVGRRECDVAADITAATISGLPGLPGEPTDAVLMPGGKQSGTSHISWRDRTLETGDHYNVEFACARFRYNAPIMRTVCLGAPNDRLRRLYGFMLDGCEAALNQARPGKTCADVARAYCKVMDQGGYWKDSRCGYPIGINWLETSCSLRVDDETILEEGMAFHLMLGTWCDEDFGAVLSESFLIGPNGPEFLFDVPRDLMIVGA